MAILMIVSLFTSRITLQALGVEDYGIYNVVGGIIIFLSFLNNTLTISTQRFLNYEMGSDGKSNLSSVFSSALTGHYIIALLFLVIAETVGLWFVYNYLVIPQARFRAMLWVYHFSVLTFFINIISTPYNAAIIACEKMGVYAYIAIVEAVMKLGVAYILFITPFDKLKLYAVLLCGVALVIRFVYFLYCRKKIRWITSRLSWNKERMLRIFSFSGWVFLGGFSQVMCVQGVNVLINIFFSPIHNAARGIAMQLQSAVHTFSANFMTAVRPQIIKSYSAGEYQYSFILTCSAAKISYYLLLIITIPLILETEYILTLWLKDVPEYAVVFTRLALIDALLSSMISPVASLSQASGKVKYYQLIISAGFILVFLLTYLFYRYNFSSYVTFIISIIMTVIGTVGRVWELKYSVHFPMQYFFKEVILKIACVSTGTLVLMKGVVCLVPVNGLFSFCFISFCSVILTCLFIWFWGISESEKKYVLNKLYFKH